eukprot:TRINITY_DN6455_c0_g1_i1.p1 TRINITY_DN6455_c0_g1~~TRINITY_DN6455_c0_g1_i1.p1  ORF type:complete len:490 (+),score=172.74 TRINITY_DN6455_c0_g1_i1:720-2189(+)
MDAPAAPALVRQSSFSTEVWGTVSGVMQDHDVKMQEMLMSWFQSVSMEQAPAQLPQINQTLVESSVLFAKQHVDVLSSLWDAYDTDGDGELCFEELSKMELHCARQVKRLAFEDIQNSADAQLATVKAQVAAQGLFSQPARTPDEFDSLGEELMAREIKPQLTAMITKAKAEVMAAEWSEESHEKHVKEVFAAIDTDGTGKIGKEAFLSRYMSTHINTFMEAMCTQIGVDMSSVDLTPLQEAPPPALTRSNSFSSELWSPLLLAMKGRVEQLQTQLMTGLQALGAGLSEQAVEQQIRTLNRTLRESAKAFAYEQVGATNALWDKYDTDGDGVLSVAEISKMLAHMTQANYHEMENQISGLVSQQMALVRTDLKNQGLFEQPASKEQYASLGEELMAEKVAGECQDMVMQMKAQGIAQMQQVDDPEVLAAAAQAVHEQLDTDHDGKVTRDEFVRKFVSVQISEILRESYTMLGVDSSKFEFDFELEFEET